jgi:catechol 2,3-dioxygenase-like lactoylglutathione lyase family enzyme
MIGGAHILIYAEDPAKARAFLRDVLGWENVDAHDGWLIFALPPAELGVHPAENEPGALANGSHELFLMCHDIEQAVAGLKAKGAEFADEIADRGFGRITHLRIPGAGTIGLYEPRHASPLSDFT